MTTKDNESQLVTPNYSELQQMATTGYNKWEQVKQNGFKFQNEAKYESGLWIILFNYLRKI